MDFYSHIPCGMWLWGTAFLCKLTYFYSHIPCGMWLIQLLNLHIFCIFLLTHPVWDVTMAFMCSSSTRNISTHTSRVGCDLFSVSLSALSAISTHTSRVGCDADLIARPALVCISTHTSRVGCDKGAATIAICLWISTHTSRVGCDNARHFVLHPLCNFYSHIPCGMWQHLAISCTISSHFYSHIPCGMWLLLTFDRAYGIIHFYSHIPCGMWPLYIVYYSLSIPIYHEMDL